MWAIMADHDIEGHLQILLRLLASPAWQPLWAELAVRVASFTRGLLGIRVILCHSEFCPAK